MKEYAVIMKNEAGSVINFDADEFVVNDQGYLALLRYTDTDAQGNYIKETIFAAYRTEIVGVFLSDAVTKRAGASPGPVLD